ncbi:MAG: PaaI family thioesterase [Myxococcota bacterium]|nr:PaaI family thioesterase [Myxococcota bacterium]
MKLDVPPEQRAQVCAVMTHGMQQRVPHNGALGLEVIDYAEHEVWMRLPYAPKLIGNPVTRVMHGGAISSLMDAACGFAVMIALGGPSKIATLDLRIDNMKPAAPGRAVIAHADCYKITQHVCFVRGTAYVDDVADPIATVTATFARKTKSAGAAL